MKGNQMIETQVLTKTEAFEIVLLTILGFEFARLCLAYIRYRFPISTRES